MVLPLAPLVGLALKYGVPAWQLYQQAKAIREKGKTVAPDVADKLPDEPVREAQKPLSGRLDKQDWKRLRATADDAVFVEVDKPPPRKPVALPVDDE